MVIDMRETPIERLNLSVRANNVLHRMGIHSIEKLRMTPINDIAQQRSVGVKTIDEISGILENTELIESIIEQETQYPSSSERICNYTAEQLREMAYHSVSELHLSTRPYRALCDNSYTTIDKVAVLSEPEYAQIKGLGKKSISEIISAINEWAKENITYPSDTDEPIDNELSIYLQKTAAVLEPIAHFYWRQLYDRLKTGNLIGPNGIHSLEDALKTVFLLPNVQREVKSFLEANSAYGIVDPAFLAGRFSRLQIAISTRTFINSAVSSHILVHHRDQYLITRDPFHDAYSKVCNPEERSSKILLLRVQGESLQSIGSAYGLTRERVRQIAAKMAQSFPLLFEDYFREPFEHFHMLKPIFIRAFPEISEEGYEYLSIRYTRGKIELTRATLEDYHGLWKKRLSDFLDEEALRNDKNTVTRSEMVMRVLAGNSDNPLSIEEFEKEYYSYIRRKGYPMNRLRINMRTVANLLRNARGIVFNRENKVRYCNADPQDVWEKIDFNRYKDSIISSELIFREYTDAMNELDIRDGYELFYVIKSSLSMWDEKQFPIHCRRVPVIIIGNASEDEQAIQLLREISPVAYFDYYAAYEERFGLRKESAQGNPTISNAVGAYYTDGQYVIDAPSIDPRDVPAFLEELGKKELWFTDDIEDMFDRICVHTGREAINASAFKRIGYTLHASYAYNSSYGTAISFFDKTIFSKDVLDLTTLDKRMLNLSMFGVALDKKKKALEFVETGPKTLMSRERIEKEYGLKVNDLRKIQSDLSVYYTLPFFNGHSIWEKVKRLPAIRKLHGNDWMLTCILRQQEVVSSLSVAGGIILSLDSNSLSLSRICEWIASQHGLMSIHELEKKFNDIFGTRISTSKLAEKLRSSGTWNKVISESLDDYIDQMVDSNSDHELLPEEELDPN